MTPAPFPKDNLRSLKATLSPERQGSAALTVDFAPFEFALPDGSGEVDPFDKPLRAEGITLPSLDLASLAGQTFDFPTNPQPGYIDASVYLMWSHTPVDITRLAFGTLSGGTLPLTLTTRWLMTYEATGFDDFDLTFEVPLAAPRP